MQPQRQFLIFAILALSLGACSTLPLIDYPERTDNDLVFFHKGDFRKEDAALTKGSETIGPDRLLFLLDRAIALHALGDYVRSNQLLWEAEKLIEPQVLASNAKLRANSTANMAPKFYHGEEFEAVLVPVYLSLNHALLGHDADAINEARRAENLLSRFRLEAKRGYTIPVFLRFWTALLYERSGNLDSAHEDLVLAEGMAGAEHVPLALTRARIEVKARSPQGIDRQAAAAGLDEKGKARLYREARDFGALLIVFENDFIAAKAEHPEFPDFPYYKEPAVKYARARIFVDGEETGQTSPSFDINRLAKENLDAKLALYKSDKAEGFPFDAMKRERMARRDPTHKRYRGYDSVAKLTADLRHWATLPANLQVAHVPVRPGIHHVYVRFETPGGRLSPMRDAGEVEIDAPGTEKVLAVRSLDEWLSVASPVAAPRAGVTAP